jgi:hypothetical protein
MFLTLWHFTSLHVLDAVTYRARGTRGDAGGLAARLGDRKHVRAFGPHHVPTGAPTGAEHYAVGGEQGLLAGRDLDFAAANDDPRGVNDDAGVVVHVCGRRCRDSGEAWLCIVGARAERDADVIGAGLELSQLCAGPCPSRSRVQTEPKEGAADPRRTLDTQHLPAHTCG